MGCNGFIEEAKACDANDIFQIWDQTNQRNYVYRTNDDDVNGWIAGMMLEFMINEASRIKTIAAAVLKSGKCACAAIFIEDFKVRSNLNRIENALREAKKQGSEYLFVGEAALNGF